MNEVPAGAKRAEGGTNKGAGRAKESETSERKSKKHKQTPFLHTFT
ncbi:hypothetical protein FLK61_37240 [Paenalkalicoccus suaedae]|uniref:Uncharacterized protein n=1 Tax=Paenalkalicoccus suaedae TaxID=2592382 RepID=A0A859FFZ5_9BACI|nr:hypothetical protein FLK61_37240 [Paenalkalicoccus suaedae]